MNHGLGSSHARGVFCNALQAAQTRFFCNTPPCHTPLLCRISQLGTSSALLPTVSATCGPNRCLSDSLRAPPAVTCDNGCYLKVKVNMPTGSVSPQTANAREQQKLAARLRGFGPVGLLGIAIILVGAMVNGLVAATVVVFWVVLSKTPWREIGYVRPGNYAATIAGGVAFGAALKLLLKAVIMPLLG